MSYSKSNNVKAIVKYCKVCHDAGKSEAEYRSHFIRESPAPTSKVVCPTLLALECRYCFNSGHTIKYCPTLKKHEKSELTNTYYGKATISPKKTLTSKSNLFECLNHDSSDEEEAVKAVKETESKKAVKETESSSYASALNKIAVPKAIVVAPAIKVVIPYKMSSISWADVEDSEPEDSDDDEEFYTCPSSSR
jgi:hypothetical protein